MQYSNNWYPNKIIPVINNYIIQYEYELCNIEQNNNYNILIQKSFKTRNIHVRYIKCKIQISKKINK